MKHLEPSPRQRNACTKLSQDELVAELKTQGTYNPDYMAWDVPGVIRWLERSSLSSYDRVPAAEREESEAAAVEKNLGALERLLRELDVDCDVRSPATIARLVNITHTHGGWRYPNSSKDRLRTKRSSSTGRRVAAQRRSYLGRLARDDAVDDAVEEAESEGKVGQVHRVPFGCSKRGSEEEGYLRLCGVCQAIRRLPDDFFPPFINEVLCDTDKACLYFYDFPHGKCKQKQMNFVVLRNLGSPQCELWRKFNLNVRVSCECFVDHMSFFAKYV